MQRHGRVVPVSALLWIDVELYRQRLIGMGTVAYQVDQINLGRPVASFGWRSLEQPIIQPVWPYPGRKAAAGDQRLSSSMTATWRGLFVENNSRMDGVAHLSLGAFRLKGQLASRATSDQEH